MARLVLGGIGQSVGGGIGAAIGQTLGGWIDQTAVRALGQPRQIGPRFEGLKVQGTGEGTPVPAVFGRARVAGQVIWAARFQEARNERSGSKGGPRTIDYTYSLSFAVALCEGPIDGIGQVWADGQPMDLSGVTMRLHHGTRDQFPDALVEAIETTAPAYRGVAYVVFEDLDLGPYGDRMPQMAFEVFRRPQGTQPRLATQIEGVCLIPGAGEFVLATEPVLRREGLTRSVVENRHLPQGASDFEVSLDQLMMTAPNLKRVNLVIGWFGNDLRAAHLTVKPGVEGRDRVTVPLTWSVAGLQRHDAHLISRAPGSDGPAYGGTPSDDTVRQAVRLLKARGLEVTLYPFVFMDIASGNDLPDPHGGDEQAAYPWRGRIVGRGGSEAIADVAAAFGTETSWGLRRMALHYATLATEVGADGLLIGSELRGLTLTRDADGQFPAVEALRGLAQACKAIVGSDVAVSYAADWSEYAGLRKDGEVRFHLDPLWADGAIDYIGIDWYPPMGDWRRGDGGVDGVDYEGADDPAYLADQVAGGESYDWFYASDADGLAQNRTPIVDTAHGEHWIWRVKDLAGWWLNAHHERVSGVRQAMPTVWVPGMKPVRLTELGCAAVDRGANAPNLFLDPKSSESALPLHSTGQRDDRIQARMLEAVLAHFGTIENNPVSPVDGRRMIIGADLWCWDARPWPAFPGRTDVWADAWAWATGHWLNGRFGGETQDLIAALLQRGGLHRDEFEVGAIGAQIAGYVVDRPMCLRDALAPLVEALGLTVAERAGRVWIGEPEPACFVLSDDRLALPDTDEAQSGERELSPDPDVVTVRFIESTSYQTGSVSVRRDCWTQTHAGMPGGSELVMDLPAVCDERLARAVAQRRMRPASANRRRITLGPLEALQAEAGDVVSLGHRGDWQIERIRREEQTPVDLLRPSLSIPATFESVPRGPPQPETVGPVWMDILDLPPLPGAEEDRRPIVALAGEPWRTRTVRAGPDGSGLTIRAQVPNPVTVGRLIQPLRVAQRFRWSSDLVALELEGLPPQSRSHLAVLNGANGLVIGTGAEREIIQYREAELTEDGSWRLSGLLRGQLGTPVLHHAAGTPVVLLSFADSAALARAQVAEAERGLDLIWQVDDPGGGIAGRTRITLAWQGVHGRPWSPAHLSVRAVGDDVTASWIPRSRRGAYQLVADSEAVDPSRYQVRVLAADTVVRLVETDVPSWTYSAAMQAEDGYSTGLEGLTLEVRQWGNSWGWGLAAQIML